MHQHVTTTTTTAITISKIVLELHEKNEKNALALKLVQHGVLPVRNVSTSYYYYYYYYHCCCCCCCYATTTSKIVLELHEKTKNNAFALKLVQHGVLPVRK